MTGARFFEGALSPRRLGLVRVAVCGYATAYVLVRLGHLWAVTDLAPSRFDPIGVVWLVADRPLAGSLHAVVLAATILAGVGATLGWRHRWTGPVFAALLWWTLSYRLSWGQVLHTENLVVLHVAVLGLSRSADAYSIDARHRPVPRHHSAEYGWPLQLMTALTALTYVIAAWAKIRNGGLEWMTGDVLRNQIAYDNLRKHLLGDVHSAFGGWLTQWRWLFPPMAVASMAVELGALVAIARSRLRLYWLLAAWAFHVGVLALMAILFPYQLFGFAFLSMLPVEVWWDRARRRTRRRVRSSTAVQ